MAVHPFVSRSSPFLLSLYANVKTGTGGHSTSLPTIFSVSRLNSLRQRYLNKIQIYGHHVLLESYDTTIS